ncbi:MAG: hypothetical protein M3508_09565, partial [Actinomycetota bacterium]|nr:hypothetical protein [Actinomycetota bacterium]
RSMNRRSENFLAKALIVIGLALLALLALKAVFGILRWMFLLAIAIGVLWLGARLLANRIPDD